MDIFLNSRRKENGEQATYGNAFGLVLTGAQAKIHGLEGASGLSEKGAFETRKINAVAKKNEAEEATVQRLAMQTEKKKMKKAEIEPQRTAQWLANSLRRLKVSKKSV